MVKYTSAIQETWIWSLGWEDPQEKELATHFSILAWEITWTEEPGRLSAHASWLADGAGSSAPLYSLKSSEPRSLSQEPGLCWGTGIPTGTPDPWSHPWVSRAEPRKVRAGRSSQGSCTAKVSGSTTFPPQRCLHSGHQERGDGAPEVWGIETFLVTQV